MGNELTEILRHLQDPELSSSLVPLILVMSLFFFGTIAALVMIFSSFKIKLPTKKTTFPNLAKPKLSLKLPEFHLRLPTFAPRPRVTGTGELDKLRELVSKLEQANAAERDMHARALRRSTEMHGEMQTLTAQHLEDQKLLEHVRRRRTDLEEKVERLEAQLRDAIRETERIYQQNATLANEAAITPDSGMTISVNDILRDFPPGAPPPLEEAPTPELVAKQAAEIQKLKQILQSCKAELLDKKVS